MSRQLNKLKNLVSEIEQIQRHGRNKAPEAYRAVQPESVFKSEPVLEPEIERTEKIIQQMIEPSEPTKVSQLRPATPEAVKDSKVSLELTGNVAVKLKLEESEETIEVRRVGDQLAISFTDGKSVHLPLKSVA